jgi:hypothetical protein
MWIQRFLRRRFYGVPLWIIGTCGLAGVLVDVDHIIPYWVKGFCAQGLHTPLAITSGIVLLCVGACCGGLYFAFVLTRRPGKSTKRIQKR